MAVELVSETFAPHVGTTFRATPPEGDALELVLSSCEETPYGDPAEWRESIDRVPFTLLFHLRGEGGPAPGPAGAPGQGIHRLEHAELGELELFLVALGPDERGMRYEAVVS